ncbi:putative ABC transporter [Aeromonas phage LAh_6]|uniref:Putative ABC transporter n=1 Tax=Aeromonas phage LAh_6 TaxID=2591030 RepID=A0A514A006_9CAUD|nr:putative ABC transporter [Aeromonas phage LAh_6]QDH46591.1 putative ABC transporter [Aeromonas phage LAh_6]
MIVNLNHIYSHLRGHCVVIVTHDTSLMRDGAAIHIHLSRNKLTVFHMGYGVSCILGGYPAWHGPCIYCTGIHTGQG